MLTPAKVDEIQRLLSEDQLSHRAIALATEVSRATVDAIASGRRPNYGDRPNQLETEPFSGPSVRCRGCGGMVYLPCLACSVRRQKQRQQAATELRRQNNHAAAWQALAAVLRQGRSSRPSQERRGGNTAA